MSEAAQVQQNPVTAEHFDVLIVGAGISGVGGAYHLQTQCPGKSFVILENQESFGGTWLTHKYPGIRSDSDLFTFGYKFKPWTGAPIASAAEILKYMNEVIDDNHIDEHIRYRHQIRKASWSSDTSRWSLEVENLETGETTCFTCNFLWMCQGYYKHEEGYTPEWEGMDDFKGSIVHPQTWPEDLDYTDKEVLVIGSGATAATLIPAMAPACKHITMLQRSPTYFFPGRNVDELADKLRELDLPDEWTHEIVRRNRLQEGRNFHLLAKENPDEVRSELLKGVKAFLGEDFDMSHFTPDYRPWQQRLAFVPDGDLFKGIASGKASVVTDHIDRFTEKGILLKSGKELHADIIVTATGFDLSVMGGVEFTVDERPVNFSDTVTYRGVMFEGIPNMAWVFGYFRTSWTIRADMIAEFVCRLLHHMESKGKSMAVPTLRESDQDMELKPWVDGDNFNPGYLQRSMHLMPKRGDRDPWVFEQDYYLEKDILPGSDLEDGALLYR